MTEQILVVDDEEAICRALKVGLTRAGYRVQTAHTGTQALECAAEEPPDLVILDVGLPDMDGREVCARLREWYRGPILILSVHDEERTKIQALDGGADDYLVKPFGMGELVARVRAARRRARDEVSAPVLTLGQLQVDVAGRRVTVRGRPVRLTPTEYNLLVQLVTHAGKVMTHAMLLTHVWGPEYRDEVGYLRVYMSQLRRKIEADPEHPVYILTEVGVGYRCPRPDELPPGA